MISKAVSWVSAFCYDCLRQILRSRDLIISHIFAMLQMFISNNVSYRLENSVGNPIIAPGCILPAIYGILFHSHVIHKVLSQEVLCAASNIFHAVTRIYTLFVLLSVCIYYTIREESVQCPNRTEIHRFISFIPSLNGFVGFHPRWLIPAAYSISADSDWSVALAAADLAGDRICG